MIESTTTARAFAVPTTLTPLPVKWWIVHRIMVTLPPPTICTPLRPVPRPSISRPSRTTLSGEAALTTMPFVPETSTPASIGSDRIVIDLVMVTAPKQHGSRPLISPWAAVFEIATANVLHGAVRLHGLASSPTPETQVRVACAFATEANATTEAAARKGLKMLMVAPFWRLPRQAQEITRACRMLSQPPALSNGR